jgi:uncharacterized protein involved in oxidation of intracellular sulfur
LIGKEDTNVAHCLLILNDPPYGTERSYNGARLAGSLACDESNEARVFLIGDAVGCAKKHQKLPRGYYSLEVMLGSIARRGAELGVCGSCMDARGMGDDELITGSRRSSTEELTTWTLAA